VLNYSIINVRVQRCKHGTEEIIIIIIIISSSSSSNKGKAIPLQARTGPGSSRRLGLSDFKTIGT